MNVFPVLFLQQVRRNQQNTQEHQHVHADALAGGGHGLRRVGQEVGNVAHIGLELFLTQLLLHFGHHVGHAHVGKHMVVVTIRTGFVLVEADQVRVYPVRRAVARGQGQIRRRRAEPLFAVFIKSKYNVSAPIIAFLDEDSAVS